MTICASRMYIGLVKSAVVNPSPVRAVPDKEQSSGAQIQFKKSPAPSDGGYLAEGTYNLNIGSVMDIYPQGTASLSV